MTAAPKQPLWGVPADLEARRARRGGAPVGQIADLPPFEAGAVHCLRLWSDGPQGQVVVGNDFAGGLGATRARKILEAFEQLTDLCVTQGRRPLMRHSVGCACLGADEACFANLIATSVEGEREDTLLLASLIVPPAMAPLLASLAAQFGLGLRRLCHKAVADLTSAPAPTLH